MNIPFKWVAVALGIVVVLAAAWFLWPSGGESADGDAGTLEIVEPTSDSPIDAAVRVELQSNLDTALSSIKLAWADAGGFAALSTELLNQAGGPIQFVDGAQPSENSRVASTRISSANAVVALSGSNGYCAFGQIDNQWVFDTVITSGDGPCSADRAPTEGWAGAGPPAPAEIAQVPALVVTD